MPTVNTLAAGALFDRHQFGNMVTALTDFLNDIKSPRGPFADGGLFTLGDLIRVGDANAFAARESERMRKRWDGLQQHPAFLQLSQDANFLQALKKFRKQTKPNLVSEARFLAEVVFYILRYLDETERPELIRQPDARTRKQAAAVARKLRQHAKKGARLENLRDQATFETLLARFTSQMDKESEKRPRNDQTRAQRLFVKRLAGDFLSRFGKPLTTVLESLAAVIGYEPDGRNIERIVSEARKEQQRLKREAVVRALLGDR